MAMAFPVPPEGKAAIVLADVPDNITDDIERKTYLSTYNKFYGKCIAGKNSKPVKCAEGSHSAATSVLKKSRLAKAGARNSRPDLEDIQTIHDKAFALGAKCKGDDKMEGKALDLERKALKVKMAWKARFDPPVPIEPGKIGHSPFWVTAVFEDVVLVENMETGDLFRYGYIIQDDGVVIFEDPPTQVEMEFVEIGKSALRKTIKTRWTCSIVGHKHNTAEEAQTCISQTTLNTPSVRSEFVKSTYSGNALKTISKTDDELIVANYMILFDGRDLEGIASKRVNADGTKGEFFTKATALESDYTDTGQLLVDWEHRRQPDGLGPDKEDIFGYVDWKTAVIDDAGLFVRRVLNRRNRYVKMLEALFDAGMIGNSTEPIQKEVVKGSDGELKIWPLKRDSFSVQPMDWRMMTSNHLEVVKALRDNPEGTELYHNVFNQETARAKAKALSLINQIGEVSYGLH